MTVENPNPEVIFTVPKDYNNKIASAALESTDVRLKRIIQGLAKVIRPDLVRASLEQGRIPKIVWATAPTGRPHIGYLVAWVKIAEFVSAGADVIVNMADIYAFLVNYKYPLPMVMQRREYYKHALNAVFETIYGTCARISGVQFECESAFIQKKEYIFDFFKLVALTSQQDSRATGEELNSTPMLSPLLCPLLQALDQQFYDVDIEYGGLDQAMLYDYIDQFLPNLGYRKRAYLMNYLLPGLNGGKMSASNPDSKIDLLDPPEVVLEKIMAAACPEGIVENNAVLSLLKLVVIPISKMRLEREGKPGIIVQDYRPFTEEGAPYGTVLSVETDKKQFRHYSSYEEIEEDFCAKGVSSGALAKVVSKAMNELLAHIRKSYEENPEWQKVAKLAYPGNEEEAGPHVTLPASLEFCLPSAIREISNERVKLLPFNSSVHSAEIIRLANGDPDLFRHMPLGQFISTELFSSNFIEGFVRPNHQMMLYTVIDKTQPQTSVDKEGALAGFLSYINMSQIHQTTEIAYVVILPRFQCTHVTSNAVGLLLNFALNTTSEGCLGLRRVQWQTSTTNNTLMRVAEEFGFVKEGVLRWERDFPGGRSKRKQGNGIHSSPGANDGDLIRDSVVFSMCWDDWFVHGKKEQVARRMAGQSPVGN